jgi:hypothetical protein
LTFERLMKRMEESKGVYKDVLALHLDYKTNETLTQIMQSLDQS